MQFHEFQKIPDCLSHYVLTKQDEKRLLSKKSEWIATEKVHGANFSVYHHPMTKETRFAKRGAFLEPNDNFYNWQTTLGEVLESKIKLMHHHIRGEAPNYYMIVYGELFGGFYPLEAETWSGPLAAGRINARGECILPVKNRAVQEGIYYSRELNFIAFDIAIVRHDASIIFLDYDTMKSTFDAVGLCCVEPLIRGTYQQVSSFAFHARDSSVGTQMFGLPTLPRGTNQMEGIVIKPVKHVAVQTRGKTNHQQSIRCIVKLKHPNFIEISGDFITSKTTASQILMSLLNVNRITCFWSKHGTGESNDHKQNELIQALMDDILDDFYTHYPSYTTSEQDLQMLRDTCEKEIVKMSH